MTTLTRRILTSVATATPGLFLAANAFATDLGITKNLKEAGGSGYGITGEPTPLPKTVGLLIQGFMAILGVFFLALTVYAGFLWMNARGNEQQVEKAKNLLTQAVIGLAIIMSGYAITNFVVNALVNATLKGA